MKYEVVWTAAAEERLAELWLDSRLRPRLAAAVAAIEARLERQGPEVGESREGNRRVAFEPPIVVVFSCNRKKRRVKVLYLWSY